MPRSKPSKMMPGKLYQHADLETFTAGTGEIFVRQIGTTNPTMRIRWTLDGIVITASNAVITPWAEQNMPAFRVCKR